MANLHFHYGVMGSSKSAKLIIEAFNFRIKETNIEIIKPAYDNRFGATQIKSRAGNLAVDAVALKNLNKFQLKPETQVLFVDEVQFFGPRDIDKLVEFADAQNVIVMCYGLMTDSNEKMFPASRRLIEVGAKLHRLESSCQIPGCMRLATHHLRFTPDGHVIHNGEQFALGDSNYKSVCRQHFNKIYHDRGR